MTMIIERRPAGNPLVEELWQGRSAGDGSFISVAATHWELVVTFDRERGPSVTLRGPATRAHRLSYAAGGLWWGIRFRLGAHMPCLPQHLLVDGAMSLPVVGGEIFAMGDLRLPVTGFDDADRVVHHLVKTGFVVVDPLVDRDWQGVAAGVSTRTVQRRFRQVTGISRRTAHQIDRATLAMRHLQAGASILDTVHELGYADQAHLTRALRRWMGQTPGAVMAGHETSFLS